MKLRLSNLKTHKENRTKDKRSIQKKFIVQMEKYNVATYYLDFECESIQAFVDKYASTQQTPTQNAIALYYAVRDGFWYNPYEVVLAPKKLKASYLLTKPSGYCVEKALLLAASARAIGIPSRLGFGDVKNHIGTEKLQEFLQSDVMVFHGYTELFLEGKWVKCTPAFNKELCEKLGVAPLEFDGKTDSVFQQFTNDGSTFMEYVNDRGMFHDFPYDEFKFTLEEYYPHFFKGN